MDRIIRATAAGDYIKMAVITAQDMVERARQIHKCSPTAAAALGRTLCAASIMGNMMKEENGSLTIRIDGAGMLRGIVAVSDSSGNIRGYVGNPEADLPLREDGKLNVGGIVGKNGLITVSRDIGLREPYIGATELVSGEIAEDVTAYLLESEQVPSACALGVLIDKDLSVKAAGGFIVQMMPFADESLIEKLENNIFLMDQLTTILDEDGVYKVFDQVLKGIDYHIVSEEQVEYKCYCSRTRVEEALSCVDSNELKSMIDEGKSIEISCQFCDAVYSFTPNDIQLLLDNK